LPGGGTGGGRLLRQQVLDVSSKTALVAPHRGLRSEDRALLRAALLEELGRSLLISPERDAPVLDVLLVSGDRPDEVHVAVAEAPHEVELSDQIVETPRREEGVHEARLGCLVDALGARRKLLVGDREIALGSRQKTLVRLDPVPRGLQLGDRLVVVLHGLLDLRADPLELRLHLAQVDPFVRYGRGLRRGRGAQNHCQDRHRE
jgi:hypothetical protein